MSRRIKRTNPKPRSRDERKEARPFKARSAHKAGPRPGGKPGAKPRFASERAERRAPEPAPAKPVEALLPEKDTYRCPAGQRLHIAIRMKKTARCCGATDHSLSNLFAQIPMHARARAADYMVGTRAFARGRAATSRCKPRSDAPASRDSRTSVRLDEGPHGSDTLPDQNARSRARGRLDRRAHQECFGRR
jgi:hypothetical protein